MTIQTKLNLLAAGVIAVGGLALAKPVAAEPVQGGCDAMYAALDAAVARCGSMGGTSLSWSGACSSTGYRLNTTCHTQLKVAV